MLPSVRGRLITASFARDVLPTLAGTAMTGPSTSLGAGPSASLGAGPTFDREISMWSERCERIGPASSVRAIADLVVAPLLKILGYTVAERADSHDCSLLHAQFEPASTKPQAKSEPASTKPQAKSGTSVGVLVVGWNELLGRAWRSGVLRTISVDGRWCFCCNGRELRIVDAHRTWSREYLEFDLLQLRDDPDARRLLWTVARADATGGHSPMLDRAVDQCATHGQQICRALGDGVLDGLRLLFDALSARRSGRHPPRVRFEHSLVVLYRVLFLMFAEARSLVPMWHPVYRDRYSLDVIVTTLLQGRPYRGLWQALNAISRLANTGCSAGDLKVTAFNGRLFSRAHAAAFESTRIDDQVLSRAVVSVSTASIGPRRRPSRIVYRDLDVEQLGSVYERVLEYEPTTAGEDLARSSETRKSSGTFYTPRALTAHLVRRTLEPLVAGRSSDQILALRVLDPAMGSGAILVAACRFLTRAAEEALIREGRWHPGDITQTDRIDLKRTVASRCLFGVDLNPMAVQLARLSLWLTSLAADKPLSFLDHHLVCGDSLIGATAHDISRQPSRASRSKRRQESLPLFEEAVLATALEHAVGLRLKLTHEPDASATVVRAKEQALAELHSPATAVSRWARAFDLWCSGWFWDDGAPPDRATFHELVDRILRGRSALPEHVTRPLLDRVERIAERHRFLHWPLMFPEVFANARGEPSANPGFDAVLGNPPWDMARGDSGSGATRDDRRRVARQLVDFAREAGIYKVESQAHLNRYQLFLERALQLVKAEGRVGLVLPAGIVTDSGTAALRRHLFERASVDAVIGIDNRGGIFHAHRSLRFVLLSCTAGRPTTEIACRFGISRVDELDARAHEAPMILTRSFLSRLSGADDLGIPELVSDLDRRIVEKISATLPWLGSPHGWNVRFGRELNASEDRVAFVPFSGDPRARPVVEGKHVEPFRVGLSGCRFELVEGAPAQARVPHRARLAYRDVASATNRLTLIAAIVPAHAVTTHTLFCLKDSLSMAEQRVLCALLNSFVANYLVRLRVNTHVTVSLVSRLPVPVVRAGHPLFSRLASLARALTRGSRGVEEMPEYAELQGLSARLYGLTETEFEHVLSTFPLVGEETRAAAFTQFKRQPLITYHRDSVTQRPFNSETER